MDREFEAKFTLGELLGRGATGAVYAATQRSTRRRVAIKFLTALQSADLLERFVREGQVLGRLSHPHIVAVFDSGRAGDQPYIVTELLDGGSLHQRLALRSTPLPIPEALRIAAQLVEGLAACHEAGIVHRDVKPANILFADDKHAKLGDFGIARFLLETAPLTATGAVIGTPRYMAPEALNGEAATFASDVYSMGCVLYEMLGGRHAAQGNDLVSLARQAGHAERPHLTELRADLAPAVAELVHRTLSPRPEDRPLAAALRDELAGFVAKPRSSRVPRPERSGRISAMASDAGGSGRARAAVAAALGLAVLVAGALALRGRGEEKPAPVASAAADPIAERVNALAAGLRAFRLPEVATELARSPDYGYEPILSPVDSVFDGDDEVNSLARHVEAYRKFRDNPRPARFREHALARLRREPWFAHASWLAERAAEPAVRAALDALADLPDRLAKLAWIENLVRSQHVTVDVGWAALAGPARACTHEAAPAPAAAGGTEVFAGVHGWLLPGHDPISTVTAFAAGWSYYDMLFPGASLEPAVVRARFRERRSETIDARAGAAIVRADIALLDPSCAFAVEIRGASGPPARALLRHPGQEPWFVALDGWPLESHAALQSALAASRAPDELARIKPAITWCRVRARVPARALPSPPWTVSVELQAVPLLGELKKRLVPVPAFTRDVAIEWH